MRLTDEQILLAAFYDRKLLEPLRNPAPECSFRTSPLHELIRYVGAQRDIERAHIRFAGTEMTLSA